MNIGKLLVLALPAFLLAYYPFIVYFGPLSFLTIPSPYFNQAMIGVSSAMYIFQIIFGYIFMTSFYKDENTPSSVLKAGKKGYT
ncbi:hypothetical protein ACLIBG_05450 [Virgibacillus sp. W0181]|uniref:hypothetical protein n=1 Tax=Virgibacillus sp. W0181 TaxID=3391581 RepID=UPI003F46986D